MPLRRDRGSGPGPPGGVGGAGGADGTGGGGGKPDLAALKAQYREKQARREARAAAAAALAAAAAAAGAGPAADRGKGKAKAKPPAANATVTPQKKKKPAAPNANANTAAKKGGKGANGAARRGPGSESGRSSGSGGGSSSGSDAEEDDSDAYSDASSSSSSSSAAALDGQELWAQSYCTICERLIEPGAGIAADGRPVSAQVERQADALKAAIEKAQQAQASALARKAGHPSAAMRRSASGGGVFPGPNQAPGPGQAGAGAGGGGGGGTGTGTGRSSRGSSRANSRPGSRDSSVSAKDRARRATIGGGVAPLSRRNSGKGGAGASKGKARAADDDDRDVSPPAPRSGMATPPGIGSGLARSQEEKRLRREGILPPGGTLAQLANAKELAAAGGDLAAGVSAALGGASGAGAGGGGGGGILGPLTPMLLKGQEQLEIARARAPTALYCSRECREEDVRRSKGISDVSPYAAVSDAYAAPASYDEYAPPHLPRALSAAAQRRSLSFGGSGIGAGRPSSSSGHSASASAGGGGWASVAAVSGPPSSGLYTASAAPWAQMPIGPSSMGGSMGGSNSLRGSGGSNSASASGPGGAGTPSAAVGGYFPPPGSSWRSASAAALSRPRSSQSGSAHAHAYYAAPYGSGGGHPYGYAAQAYTGYGYGYGYGYAQPYQYDAGYPYGPAPPLSRSGSRTPDHPPPSAAAAAGADAYCNCPDCQAQALQAQQQQQPQDQGLLARLRRRSSSRVVAPMTPQYAHAHAPRRQTPTSSEKGKDKERDGGPASASAGAGADSASAVPSGASDTTESSGGAWGSGAAGTMRAKKRTQSGRVETPLNLQPGQAASGDYFAGAGAAAAAKPSAAAAAAAGRKAPGTGSASTNGTEDSTLSWWEDTSKAARAHHKAAAAAAAAAAARSARGESESAVDDDGEDEQEQQQRDYFDSRRRSSSRRESTGSAAGTGPSSLSRSSMTSPLRLLKRDTLPVSAAGAALDASTAAMARSPGGAGVLSVSATAAAAAAPGAHAQPSTSFNNASGFLSRSLASEHTELGTSATTTGTAMHVSRAATIRDRRQAQAQAGSSGVARSRTTTVTPTSTQLVAEAEEDEDEAADLSTASAVGRNAPPSVGTSFDQAEPLDAQSFPFGSGSLRGAADAAAGEGISSAMESLRLAQKRSSIGGGMASLGAPSPEMQRRRSSTRWSFGGEAGAAGPQAGDAGGQPSSSSSGWWRSFIPAWATIKALQALSNSQDSDDEDPGQRPPGPAQPPAEPGPGLVKPSGRRDQVPDYAREVGHGAIPGEESPERGSAAADEEEARRRRRAERERAAKHQRSKDVHVLPPLLAPSNRSGSNTNLRLAHPRASRSGSSNFGQVVPSPMHGSFGGPRSVTPGAPPVYGLYRSTTPSSIPPPSPGLRALRNPASRGSFSNLPTLGEAIMRPPSRSGSAMGMHPSSLSASPRRAGLGWGPMAPPPPPPPPMYGEVPHALSPAAGRTAHGHRPHPHHHHHHHHHSHSHHQQYSSQDSQALSSSFEEAQREVGDQLARPGSGLGRFPRPRSLYGAYGPAPEGLHPSMSATQLARLPSDGPSRTWSYERMPGLKTYPVMQLPNRKPAHDVYDNWSEALAERPLAEDPAEEASADAEQEAAASRGDAQRKRLFYFDS